MNTTSKYSGLIDELVAGDVKGNQINKYLDLILTWLSRPDIEKVQDFKNAYLKRGISSEILRNHVLHILEQNLFGNDNSSAHQIFGLPHNATKEDIKSRYRKLIRVYHPDRGVGDSRILNHHSERINQAYKELSSDKARVKKITVSDYSAEPIFDRQNESGRSYLQDSFIIRKLRRKLGDVKKFQITFFGVAFSVSLLLIFLIYIQPDNITPVDTSRYEAKSIEFEEAEQIVVDKNQVNDAQITMADSTADAEQISTIENRKAEITSNLIDTDNINEIEPLDTTVVQNRDSSRSIGGLDNNGANETDRIQSDPLYYNDEMVIPVSQGSEIAEADNQQSSISDIPGFEAEHEKPTVSDNADVSEKQSVKIQQESTQQESTVQYQAEQNKNLLTLPQEEIWKNENKTILATQNESGLRRKKPEKSTESKIPVLKEIRPETSSIQDNNNVPVVEVDISKIPLQARQFEKANLFERRFARNFVIEYLESIERGSINLIEDFLSDGLSVNGVSNNKINYLKSTTQLISDTEKRSYEIKILGDVLRLDKGSFRVIFQEHRTIINKSKQKLIKTSTKSYDIKRYRNGSEIVSIADV